MSEYYVEIIVDVVDLFGQRGRSGGRAYGVAEGDEGGKCLRRGAVAEISSLFVSLFARVHQNSS